MRQKIKTQLLVKVSTFGRPELLVKCLDSFVAHRSHAYSIFFCVTCNHRDETMDAATVQALTARYQNIAIFFGDHASKIDAYNADIDQFEFDALVLASDDMQAVHQNYDSAIYWLMEQSFPDFDGVLWFDTCDGNRITDTLSIVGRKFYERFGYAYNSAYRGYYCDDEFTQVAFKLGKLRRIDDPIICHNVPDHLTIHEDSTYLKSFVYGTRDKALYKIRKRVQFDIAGAADNHYTDLPPEFFQEARNKNQTSWRISYPRFDDPISPLELYILEDMDRKVAAMDVDTFKAFASRYFADFRWQIPPVIHQIWFGQVPPQIQQMMDTFAVDYVRNNPGWRYVLWDERRLQNLGMFNQDIFAEVTAHDSRSDIARLEILNRFGGFYIDSDCVWLGAKTLSGVPNQNGIMIAYEKAGNAIGTGLLNQHTTRCANGVFGATLANPIIAFLIGQLRRAYTANKAAGSVASTGPDFVQNVLTTLSGLVTIADHKYFYPTWWCTDASRNPDCATFQQQRTLSPAELAALHPESVLFHKGFTSVQKV